jgi:hypothetical protein
VHTDLAAATIDLVLGVVVLIIDVQDDIAASEGVNDLSEILGLAILNVGNGDLRSVEAVASALARSIDEQEGFVVELFGIVDEIDLELEWSAFSAHELSSTATGLLLALEELLAFLLTVLADGEDVVGVLTFTAGHDLSELHLLLDEDTVSAVESVETLLLLVWALSLLRDGWLRLRIAWLLESRLRLSITRLSHWLLVTGLLVLLLGWVLGLRLILRLLILGLGLLILRLRLLVLRLRLNITRLSHWLLVTGLLVLRLGLLVLGLGLLVAGVVSGNGDDDV